MKSEVKRLLVYAAASLILFITIWLINCLVIGVNSKYGTTLSIISLIPCISYVVFGTKLLNALDIERFYQNFYWMDLHEKT